MLNETKTRRINLTVPTGWNQCSAEQLEAVAKIILRRTAMQDRYHPYDPLQMKTEAFFALAGLTVLDKRTEETEDDMFLCSYVKNKKEDPFPLAVWQVHSFIDQHLGWLDEFTGLQLFPYHDLGHYWRFDRHWPFAHRHRLGFDGELLDGMTWQQYRFAQEWLSYYVDVNGQLATAGQSRGQVLGSEGRNEPVPMTTLTEALRARTEFLRAVYRLPDGHSPRALKQMSPARFQVILIWWQSMMREMQQKYRRCFTKGKGSQSQTQLPIDLYTRSTATLQDKYHLTEEQINLQPCRVILQHLEDMAQEAEELERIQRQNKSHKH